MHKSVIWTLAVWGTAVAAASAEQPPIRFNRDVRPIFAKHCTACHGGVKAASDLSFVYRDSVLGVVEPGEPDDSELMRRLTTEDAEERMPPDDHGGPLKKAEIAVIRRWIAEGARWSEPWSFVLPVEPPSPKVTQADWARSKMDALVLAAMEGHGLAPSPAAPPHEWLRRVCFDLIGLPPSLELWERFQRAYDADPQGAKEHVVDELLESPRYGEHWAAMWLDAARYADTYGFEKDPERTIWPWRDWVIRAFNADMPFDQFTIKQLAGDLLDQPGPDDLLATAFHRNTQNNTEGGTDDEEFRLHAVLDRVNTTWTVWQGTTFGCVQCHSHPYDPFPQEDYYRFLALFNQTEDCDQNDDFPKTKVAKDPARQAEVVRLEQQTRRRREQLNADGVRLASEVTSWQRLKPLELKPSHGTLEADADGWIRASGTLPVGVVYTLKLPAVSCSALRVSIRPEQDDPTTWPERGAVLSQFEWFHVSPDGKRQALAIKEVFADSLGGRYDPQDSLKGSADGFGGYPVLERPRWAVFVLETPWHAAGEQAADAGHFELVLRQKAASNSGTQACTLRRFALDSTDDDRWTTLAHDSRRQQSWQEYRRDLQAWNAIDGVLVPVMRERRTTARRATRIFLRGNFKRKGDEVEPGIPVVFMREGQPPVRNRLELARWLVSDANPLTARVFVNRIWGRLFGRGIVESEEDFGSAGLAPSHPELLDHLALRFSRHHRWSLKKLLREWVLSATYGQTSRITPEKLQADPNNRWLARGPRLRLTAEMVRDQALAASGLLSDKLGGPPVFPPQPAGIWKTVYSGAKWTTSTGPDRYRRAIYTYWRRTAGYPMMLTFDTPTRDACKVRRIPTNTPLQALVTLNDPAFFELAAALAKRMEQGGGSVDEKIARGYRILLLAEPAADAVETLKGVYADALKIYQADAELCQQVAKSPELAALVLVANTLLNMDRVMAR